MRVFACQRCSINLHAFTGYQNRIGVAMPTPFMCDFSMDPEGSLGRLLE